MSRNKAAEPGRMTTGQAAQLLGVPSWRLGYLYRTGALPEPAGPRVGTFRLLGPEDVQAAREYLAKEERCPR